MTGISAGRKREDLSCSTARGCAKAAPRLPKAADRRSRGSCQSFLTDCPAMKQNPGLRAFLKAANENETESLSEYSGFLDFIDDVDCLFRLLIQVEIRGDPIAATLFLNAHASFLAASRLAVSGQSPPAFMVLRGALESALYGLIASQSEENGSVWLNRDRDLARSRKLYTARNGLKFLGADPNLKAAATEAYELTIEFGAHPNARSVLEHLHHDLPNRKVLLTYLSGVPSMPTARAIIACIETGIVISYLFPHVFPHHENALRAHRAATEIRRRLDRYLLDHGYTETAE
jgi:hypothetical protein